MLPAALCALARSGIPVTVEAGLRNEGARARFFRGTKMKLAWFAIVGEILLCMAAGGARLVAADQGSYRISGMVVSSLSGTPSRQAHVVAAPAGSAAGQRETTTGADGKFAFEKVPAGPWTLTAERKGYLRQSYGQHDLFKSTDSSVITGPHGASENLVLPLRQPAAVSGKVVDDHGEPVPNAIVHWLVEITSAHKLVAIRKVVATDDQGEYRLFDLPPTTCYLSVVVPNPDGETIEAPGFVPILPERHRRSSRRPDTSQARRRLHRQFHAAARPGRGFGDGEGARVS